MSVITIVRVLFCWNFNNYAFYMLYIVYDFDKIFSTAWLNKIILFSDIYNYVQRVIFLEFIFHLRIAYIAL